MFYSIIKRDGRTAIYDIGKVAAAIEKAMEACGRPNEAESRRLAQLVEERLVEKFRDEAPGVEDIQDALSQSGPDGKRLRLCGQAVHCLPGGAHPVREMNSRLMKIYDELTFVDAGDSDMKRDNANVDGDTAMGTMLKYGSEGAKDYYEKYLLTPEQSKAYREGDIHIHDFDFYTLTTTCCQIDLLKLFHGGFSTGHGFCGSPTTSRAMRRWPASPSSPTRTTSTAARVSRILITAWPPAWPRPTASCMSPTSPRRWSCSALRAA